jgi:Raf kinase inhibitor-like YbhB/YbcL family protein
MHMLRIAWCLPILFVLCSCRSGVSSETPRPVSTPTITVTSSAFSHGSDIPKRYTADGENVSPPISWKGIPKAAKSIALICDDPDAPSGNWTHWVIFDIPANAVNLPEHVPVTATLPSGAEQGINDFGNVGYSGPSPPNGTHRYYFRVYALDEVLYLNTKPHKADLEKAMKDHVLASGELMGKYGR